MTRDAATLAVLLISRSTFCCLKNWAASRNDDRLYAVSTAQKTRPRRGWSVLSTHTEMECC